MGGCYIVNPSTYLYISEYKLSRKTFPTTDLNGNPIQKNYIDNCIKFKTKSGKIAYVKKSDTYGSTQSKARDKRKTTKSRNKTVVYHCSAKALRASGWTESTSLTKAKKGAIRQCMKRRVSTKACVIQNCYKK